MWSWIEYERNSLRRKTAFKKVWKLVIVWGLMLWMSYVKSRYGPCNRQFYVIILSVTLCLWTLAWFHASKSVGLFLSRQDKNYALNDIDGDDDSPNTWQSRWNASWYINVWDEDSSNVSSISNDSSCSNSKNRKGGWRVWPWSFNIPSSTNISSSDTSKNNVI